MLSPLLQGTITALEATASVLLVLAYGALATTYLPFLNEDVVSGVSKAASNIFLPCLIFTEMGKDASPKELQELWILPVFNIAITAISLIYAYIGIKLFKLPLWIATAAAFPDLQSLPLLLVETLSVAGALHKLAVNKSDTNDDVLSRASTYLLLTGLIGNIIRFALAPLLLRHAKKDEKEPLKPNAVDEERRPLLQEAWSNQEVPTGPNGNGRKDSDNKQSSEERSARRYKRSIWELLNAPLVSAVLTLVIGFIRPLRKAFHKEGGALNASFTQSLKTIGKLYAGTGTFFFGGSLASKKEWRAGVFPLAYLFVLRFLIVPSISIGAVYGLRTRFPNYIRKDPVLDFVLAISHSGPPAMTLTSVVDVIGLNEAEESTISLVLLVSYLVTPLMSFSISAALTSVDKLYK